MRTKRNNKATMPVPSFDLDRRRKKESIGIPGKGEGLGRQL
jgi:hypothetical protein